VDEVSIYHCDGKRAWSYFARHHYLSGTYHGHGAMCAVFNDQLIGFTSFISHPSGTIPQPARRAHRTVILPDYQGMGIGVRLSDFMGAYTLGEGYRFFSKTSHPRMGAYRDASPLWKPTTKNHVARLDSNHGTRWAVKRGVAFSHEFIGNDPQTYEDVLKIVKGAEEGQDTLWEMFANEETN